MIVRQKSQRIMSQKMLVEDIRIMSVTESISYRSIECQILSELQVCSDRGEHYE